MGLSITIRRARRIKGRKTGDTSGMDTVFIIGGSSGIGLELARLYAATHRVVTFQRRPCPLSGVESVPLDVTDAHGLEEKLSEALTVAVPRIVVYAAGMSLSMPYSETPLSTARTLYETNYWGYVRTLKVLLPRLQKGARVVALSSLASILPIPFDPFYTSSKSALNALNEALGAEYRHIRFLSVLVGATRTGFSFKRLVSERNGVPHDNATSALQFLEQHGLSPATVAGGIALLCDRPAPPPRPTVGASNVGLKLAERLLPARVKLALTRLVFFRFPRLIAHTPYAPAHLKARPDHLSHPRGGKTKWKIEEK